MAQTHWKKLINPDYIGAYALDPGKDLIVQIEQVRREMVTGADGKKEECTVAHLVGQKPLILNVTNCKTIEKLYGPYIEDWGGKYITLYAAKVKAFGDVVEALRIRPKAPSIKTYICADCRRQIQGAKGKSAEEIAALGREQYGRELCVECAKREQDRRKKLKEAEANDKQDDPAGPAGA